MNVKFNSDELSCLLGSEYDQVYSVLKRTLGADGNIFSERSAGHGYLQWSLPGDGWHPITQSDPSSRNELYAKVSDLKARILQRFGSNRDMASRVLTTPNDSFIYYKEEGAGNTSICLVAWGYQFPERVSSSDVKAVHTPKGLTEKVTISFVHNGMTQPFFPFRLNGYQRTTSASGIFAVGYVTVGQQLSIQADGIDYECVVAQGKGDIKIHLNSSATNDIGNAASMDQNAGHNNAEVGERTADIHSNLGETTDGSNKNADNNKTQKEKNTTMLPLLCLILLIVAAYILGLKII